MSRPAPTPAPGAAGPPESQSGRGRALEAEDLVLALWLGVVEYLIRRYTGDDLWPLIESLDLRVMELTWDTPWAWVAQPGLVIGALLALALVPLSIAIKGRAPRAGPTGSRAALPSTVRRTLIVPIALIGTSLCRDVSRSFVRDEAYSALSLTTLHIVLPMLSFLFLVAAPRIVVGATTHWRRWMLRFALFYAAWLAGALAEW